MALKNKTHDQHKTPTIRPAPEQAEQAARPHERLVNPATALQRAVSAPPAALRPADVLALQRTIGNRAVRRLLSSQSLARPSRTSTPANAHQLRAKDEGLLKGSVETSQAKENNRSLPDELKAGIESLSGLAMDDVRVHYNSPAPAQVHALAFTQGTDIHLGPNEERHLPHEAWHVAQQKQGRVRPTLQLKGVAINDDEGLEREADVMGARARLSGNHSLKEAAGERGAVETSESGLGSIPMHAPLQLLTDDQVTAYMPVKPFNAAFEQDHVVTKDSDFTDDVARTRRGNKAANTILRIDESQGKDELKAAIKNLNNVDEQTVVGRNYLWNTQNSYNWKKAKSDGGLTSGDSKHQLGMILVEKPTKHGKEIVGIKITHYEKTV